jgi:hypothetical protein
MEPEFDEKFAHYIGQVLPHFKPRGDEAEWKASASPHFGPSSRREDARVVNVGYPHSPMFAKKGAGARLVRVRHLPPSCPPLSGHSDNR